MIYVTFQEIDLYHFSASIDLLAFGTKTYLMFTHRSYRLNVRFSETEWKKANRQFANSTCRTLSEYARKLLTDQPIHQFFRNPPLEDLLFVMLPLVDCMALAADAMAHGDPEHAKDFGNMMEAVEDIRTYLGKLSGLCDPK